MFGFFKRGKTATKHEHGRTDGGNTRPHADRNSQQSAGAAGKRAEATGTLRKDVINLLIPSTDYCHQKTGVAAIFQNIMAGKRKNKKKNRHKNKLARAESYKEISTTEEHAPVNLYRSHSQLDESFRGDVEVLSAPVSEADLTYDVIFDGNTDAPAARDADAANFVKELVLNKYKNKSPQPKRQHVSLVYVSSEPTEEQRVAEKEHATSLLREIARKINCELNEPMGAADSKNDNERKNERRYEANNDSMSAIKDDLKHELENLLKTNEPEESEEPEENTIENGKESTKIELRIPEEEIENHYEEIPHEKDTTEIINSIESPNLIKKSNLKPPRSDTEGCSDDDRSDSGKKKVTFRKTIVFDDGDEQTDDEVDSSFESLTSSEEEEDEEEEEEEKDEVPDNDEMLGGVTVARNDDKPSNQEDNEDFDQDKVIKISENDTKHYDSDGCDKKCDSDKNEIQRINSENSDSGFLEISEIVEEVEEESETESEEVTDSEESDTEEDDVAIIVEPEDDKEYEKTLVTQEDVLSTQVNQLSELANTRCEEVERARDLLTTYRKDIQARDHEITQLKSDLSSAYKEVELIRQRSRSLEEELVAARSCSADLAGKLSTYDDGVERSLRQELDAAHVRISELETRLVVLEKDRTRLERERHAQEQRALEAVEAAEASSARWKAAHEAARSQAAARAERLLADCEWKMRELEKRARDAEKLNKELTEAAKKIESQPSATHQAELQQLRGLVSEQQRSVQSLSTQLQRVEAREDALQVEVNRLKDLLAKEAQAQKEKDERHMQTVARLESTHSKRLETVRSELNAQHSATRATLERAHAERTRTALAQLRAEHEREERNHERKMREQQNRYDTLKETLEEKMGQHEEALAEANSRADWELLQLRHLLDKADINYANNIERSNEAHEKEIDRLNEEWSQRLQQAEDAAEAAAGEARILLENTRVQMESERCEQLNRLKEQHRKEMDEQWENFMLDKESCLARMKLECRQEGEEEMTRREKDMLEEINELKSQIALRSNDYDDLSNKAAACGRTLAVTEQELREALEREKELRSLRSEDAEKLKQAKSASRNDVEHLQRKCACLRKLFDDMRAKLAAREKVSAEESRLQQREITQLKTEVARLTKMLMEQSLPSLGARTRADGCDFAADAEHFFCEAAPQVCETQPSAPRRKGGTLRTPELQRKRPSAPEPLRPLNLTNLKPLLNQDGDGRRRAKSVDLPAVQVPVRIKQLEDKIK